VHRDGLACVPAARAATMTKVAEIGRFLNVGLRVFIL
jgi:hypothetical protein